MNAGTVKKFNLKIGHKIYFLNIKLIYILILLIILLIFLNIINIYVIQQLTQIKNQQKNLKKERITAKWTLEQEELLAEWAEKAACYRWLHNKSEKQYRCRNYAFTIPVIILSTLT